MKVDVFFILVAGLLVFGSLGFVSSEIVVEDNHLQEIYSPGEEISGWIEVGFVNESNNLSVRDSFGNEVNLSQLLESDSSYDYDLDNELDLVNSEVQTLSLSGIGFYVPVGIGDFNYTINISNVSVLSEEIVISDLESAIPKRIELKREQLENLSSQIESYSLFLRSSLSQELNISEMEETLDIFEEDYNDSESLEEYQEIYDALQDFGIPLNVYEIETAENVFFVSNENSIDLDFVQEIAGGSYEENKETKYKEAIVFWNQQNLGPTMTFRKFGVDYESGNEIILSYVEIGNSRADEDAYLFLDDLDNLNFKEDYGEERKSGKIYLLVSDLEEEVVFSTSEDLDFDNLPFYFSPSLSDVSLDDLGEDIINGEEEEKISKWVWFSLVIVFLIILFVVAYVVLKTWYDRKYEKYLFKSRNNLYNLVVYIHNAKKKGVSNSDIEKQLRKSHWSNEQIRYVMRKYAGKRTGLWVPSFARKSTPVKHKN